MAINTPTMDDAKKWAKETKERPLPFAWNFSAFLSVILPLLVYFICRSRFDAYDANNQHDDNEYCLGALIFVYIWTLLSFGVLVYFGNIHIGGGDENAVIFRVVLLMFANSSLVACILSATNMHALDGREWDGRIFSLFPTCMMLTYALWTFLCLAVSFGLFYKKYKALKSEKQSSDGTADYQRQSDEETFDSVAPPPAGDLS